MKPESSIIFLFNFSFFSSKMLGQQTTSSLEEQVLRIQLFLSFFKIFHQYQFEMFSSCVWMSCPVWCFCFVLLIPGMLGGLCGNVILKIAALQRLTAAPADGGPLLMHDSFTAHYRPTLLPAQASPLGYLMEAIAWGVGGGG